MNVNLITGLHTPTHTPLTQLLLSLFSRVRLCATPMDCSLPGSSVRGILQARVLEWGAIAFSCNCIVMNQFNLLLWGKNTI